MTIHTSIAHDPTRAEAEAALSLLRRWAQDASPEQAAALDPLVVRLVPGQDSRQISGQVSGRNAGHVGSAYPVLDRGYPADFTIDDAYRASLPDLQNGPAALIRGARSRIQHVGISNFRLPIRFRTRDGAEVALETGVTGTVSLESDRKGINMSRIMRSFYRHAATTFSFDVITSALADYRADLDAIDARIQMRLRFPMLVTALRSGLQGYQYYDIALEQVDRDGAVTRIMHLDYVYSSTCPCSLELSEHARSVRGQLATPHSQRSVARLSVEVLANGPTLWFEDLIAIARAAVPTETQVMVKREDEQAFAELNAANPIFVEDAARLFCEGLRADPRIGDFRVLASHQESLHSHDAISVLTEGPTFAANSLDPRLFASLIHSG